VKHPPACRRAGWLVPCILLQLCAVGAAAQTDSQVVASVFPQRLIDESQRDYQAGGPLPFQTFSYVAADLDHDGSNYLVAAYSNGFSGAVRVLRRANGTARVVAEPDLPLLGGIFPEIRLVDIEGDDRPEVAVSYSSARGPAADWLFRWDGAKLTVFGPTTRDESGDIDTELANADFVDVNGDGILEIVNPTESDSGIGGWEVYRLEGSDFVPGGSLCYLGDFSVSAAMAEESFAVERPGPGFMLTVVNGDRDGSNRVRVGTIRLNGAAVVSPGDLGEGVRTVVRAVSLSAENRVALSLEGPAGSHVQITVGPAPR
jgi:hypothetical protein